MDGAEEETLAHIRRRLEEDLHVSVRHADEKAEDAKFTSRIFTTAIPSHEDARLVARFQRLMMEEELFLLPGLTLNDVCKKLQSNKTYVSKMVNNTFNMGFPELVNTLRVDYAQRYILRHPDAVQSDIAEKCGFISASSFNNTFKNVTGMTPKAWVNSLEGK